MVAHLLCDFSSFFFGMCFGNAPSLKASALENKQVQLQMAGVWRAVSNRLLCAERNVTAAISTHTEE